MLAGAALVGSAQAIVLTALPGVTTSAGSCYLGCGGFYDHGNIIDGAYGGDGNRVGDSWNSGYLGGGVQADFGSAYQFDHIELYAGNGAVEPYTLSVSLDGNTWSAIGSGAYHVEPGLSQPASLSYQGVNFGIAAARRRHK